MYTETQRQAAIAACRARIASAREYLRGTTGEHVDHHDREAWSRIIDTNAARILELERT